MILQINMGIIFISYLGMLIYVRRIYKFYVLLPYINNGYSVFILSHLFKVKAVEHNFILTMQWSTAWYTCILLYVSCWLLSTQLFVLSDIYSYILGMATNIRIFENKSEYSNPNTVFEYSRIYHIQYSCCIIIHIQIKHISIQHQYVFNRFII